MQLSWRNLIIGIVVIAALGGAYLYFFPSVSTTPLTASTPSASEQQFLDLAGQLQPVSFDTSIFSDPRFSGLIDLTVPLTPEIQGRTDPFGPIAGLAPTNH